MGDTTIRVSDALADELHDLKNRGDTYEDVIWRLLENDDDREDVPADVERAEPPADQDTRQPRDHDRRDAPPESPPQADETDLTSLPNQVAELDLPGSGDTLDARHGAVLACVRYLREHGQATKADFQADVYPDRSAGYQSDDGWWNTIGNQGLAQLAQQREDLHKPGEGEHTWEYLGDVGEGDT